MRREAVSCTDAVPTSTRRSPENGARARAECEQAAASTPLSVHTMDCVNVLARCLAQHNNNGHSSLDQPGSIVEWLQASS